MISDTLKRLAVELEALAVTIRHAKEREFPADIDLELARLSFLLYQRRIRESAIHYNYLAVCHRIGIENG